MPHEQVDPGGDHGGGVNQGRHRGGAGHGVRQPHRQGQLRRFARRRPQEQQAQGRGQASAYRPGFAIEIAEGEAPEPGDEEGQGDAEGHVADAGDDKGLAAGIGVGLFGYQKPMRA